MITIFFSGVVFVLFAWAAKNRMAAVIAAFFILFSLITRTASLVYVDLFGPIHADQLGFEVGGGPSMPLFAGGVLAFMLPLVVMFKPASLARRTAPTGHRPPYNASALSRTLLFVTALFVAVAYVDLVVRGPIPLFVGMDRLEYKSVAGPLYGVLYDHGFAFGFVLGVAFVIPRLSGADFSLGAVVVFFFLLVYFALTGNRFSIFYLYTAFFVLPLAALVVRRQQSSLCPPPARRSPLILFLISRSSMAVIVTLGVLGVLSLLLNSVINVRAYDDPSNLFFQRIVVQPVELWWATFAELDFRAPDSFKSAWDALFVNPIDPTRNTSIRLLMINTIGFDRALELADAGNQFAGGYPEIFFELLGTWFSLPVALAFGSAAAWILRSVVCSVCMGRIGTAVCGLYVFYGFSLLYIGGMLNFLLAWTYWVKLAAFASLSVLERRQSIGIVRPTGGSPARGRRTQRYPRAGRGVSIL